jgi:hypothetical protein
MRDVVLNRKISQAARTSSETLTLPAELMPFSQPSFLLPGEDVRDFEVIRNMMISDIHPQTNIEWLWTLDLIELSWEILRYRRLKNRILETHRVAAIEAILRRLDGEGMPPEGLPMVEIQAKRTATEWRDDRDAAIEIEGRLYRGGFDNIDINAEVFIQARKLFEMFDQLIRLAQNRRIGVLREINIGREFARRARRVIGALDGL